MIGGTSTEQFPLHSYTTTGTYIVTLEITTADGCISKYLMTLDLTNGVMSGDNVFGLNVSSNTEINSSKLEIQVAPNPFTIYTTLKVNNNFESKDALISVMDYTGKVVYTSNVNLIKGEQVFDVNLNNLPAGMYQMSVKTDKTVNTTKVVKL